MPNPCNTFPASLPAPTNAGTKLLAIDVTKKRVPLYKSDTTVSVAFNPISSPFTNTFDPPFNTVDAASTVTFIILAGTSINELTNLPTVFTTFSTVPCTVSTTLPTFSLTQSTGFIIFSLMKSNGVVILFLTLLNNLPKKP